MDYDKVASDRAVAGAQYLDKYVPGWVQLLQRPVSMASSRNCVLAQLFGRFRDGAQRLHLEESVTLQLGFRACSSELGHDMQKFSAYYKVLTKAWESEIAQRK